MKAYPTRVGKIHFCGIGGIGMSGIAEILYDMDYKIQGSDNNTNNNVKRLQKDAKSKKVNKRATKLKHSKKK